jgi:transcriptional regulator GlxA family with amidase domain
VTNGAFPRARPTSLGVAIFVFDEVEVLDFAGPYEVFTTASRVLRRSQPSAAEAFTVFTVAKSAGPVRARAGLVVQPDHLIDGHPGIDLLVVPGGVVKAELEAPEVSSWIAGVSRRTRITASVCTGAFLLAKAGLLDGRKATTHWEDIAELRATFPAVSVIEQGRWIDEGAVVTSAGITAGIDMSLHLVERLAGRDLAQRTARQMDFVWHEET